MTAPIGSGIPAPPKTPAEAAALRKSAEQLEGLFVRQLFSAMRETVPNEGAIETSSGEQMFTTILDEQLADAMPGRWHRGLAKGIETQMQARLHPAQDTP